MRETKTDRPVRGGGFGLYLLVFASALILLLLALTPDRERSEAENRMLAARPAFTEAGLMDGSFFSGLEAWFADQFPGRDGWISLRLLGLKLLGRHESNAVILGADGYLFAVPEAWDEDAAAERAAAVIAFSEAYPDLRLYFAAVPSAALVLRDRVPENYPLGDQEAQLAALRRALGGAASCPDMLEVLGACRDEYIYYRTDHHWTSLGAYRAFEALAGVMGLDPVRADRFAVSADFEGTLASRSGDHTSRDDVEVFVPADTDVIFTVRYSDSGEVSRSPYVSEALENKDRYTVFFGGNHPLVEIRTTAETGRSLLVFKDSYANCLVPLLTPYFENILMVDPRYYYEDLGLLLSSEPVTDVLFVYSADTLASDTALPDVLRSALS